MRPEGKSNSQQKRQQKRNKAVEAVIKKLVPGVRSKEQGKVTNGKARTQEPEDRKQVGLQSANWDR